MNFVPGKRRLDTTTGEENQHRVEIAACCGAIADADVFTPAKRSAVMALIRGSGNKDTELRMTMLLRAHGITGWRRNARVFGKPDFVFRRERVAVFVDGCFWHGCPKPKHAPLPKNRAEWWAAKLSRNKFRDQLVTRTLKREGWRVVRVWECDLLPKAWSQVALRIARALQTHRVPARRKSTAESPVTTRGAVHGRGKLRDR